jgi:FixJ family two-component response regulator
LSAPSDLLEEELAANVACLVLDVQLGDSNGLDFQQELIDSGTRIPVVLISGHGDIAMTVRAMRAGAITFLPKPLDENDLLAAVREGEQRDEARRIRCDVLDMFQSNYSRLTPREREIFGLVTSGLLNKQIAGRLNVSEITVKIHRSNLMRKMRAESLATLARMAEALGVREPVSRYKRG